MTTLADLGEMRLIDEILLPGVGGQVRGDDCALIPIDRGNVLWSIDPCPTPVAALLGCCTPEAWGRYTAAINLSDVAACGGQPIGMLVSLELADNTDVDFVIGFQNGLLAALAASGAELLGGNVKASRQFAATGSILGRAGARTVTRRAPASDCTVVLIGNTGSFWAAVAGQLTEWAGLDDALSNALMPALLAPTAQTKAGRILGDLPFDVACMDCSDGVGSAVQQLAISNGLDVVLDDNPNWAIRPEARYVLEATGFSIENACYHFGDWQLACLVADECVAAFTTALDGLPLTRLGKTVQGTGTTRTRSGKRFTPSVMNKNFAGGYNSIRNAGDLIEKYLGAPVLL